MPGIDPGVGFYITFEKARCRFGDDGFFDFHGLYLFEVVTAVHLPAPLLEKTDMDCVFRAVERTAHAHQAMVMEFDVAPGVTVYVLCRAGVDALVTTAALVGIHFIEEGVYVAADILRSGNDSGHESGPRLHRLAVRDIMRDLIDKNIEKFVVHPEHFVDQCVIKTEMDVVGHQEMVFVVRLRAEKADVAEQILRGSVVCVLRFSGILVDEHLLPSLEALVPDELEESPGSAVSVNRVAQTDDVVRRKAEPFIVERIYLIDRSFPSYGVKPCLQLCGKMSRIESACEINEDTAHQ